MSNRISAAGPALLIIAWLLLVAMGTLHRWWIAPVHPGDDPAHFIGEVHTILDTRMKGNVAFLLIEEGRVAYEHYDSREESIDGNTLFQLASISKWVTAWGVLALVEEGLLDPDAPVEAYLTRWEFPPGRYDSREVTVRRLLSHTAGLTDRLGYLGFTAPGDLQSLEDALTRPADAAAGSLTPVRVGRVPGGRWQYSGGGYALLQLLTEEITDRPFNRYMEETVLGPLGMTKSTFSVDDAVVSQLARHYDTDGEVTPHRYFSAPATSSLHATPYELVRFLQAHIPGTRGEPPGRGVLSPAAIGEMVTPEGELFGIGMWALGPALFGIDATEGEIIGHDGRNLPGISNTARINLQTGDGLVVLSSGDPDLAPLIGTEWVYWKTGAVDLPALARRASSAGVLAVAGVALIGAVTFLFHRRRRRNRNAGHMR